ncbi:nucleolar protein 6 [Daktulosphaira vitifoliae]|uniref:nucleolar protein 6 n=1 Tax=Daktulosphaira vitifoliae TaxID=58002 RepID=UPI0021A97B0C|nr:nucleolar protein 6 [Daktulosphaira vitifoliae]
MTLNQEEDYDVLSSMDIIENKVGRKRKKKQIMENGKKIKPPTAEELNKLRETENLFLSNMFRLQIDEMLKEVKPKEPVLIKINEWFLKFKSIVLNEIDNSDYKKELLSNINSTELVSPFHLSPLNNTDGTFRFIKPVDVKIVGSYSIGTSLMPILNIDVSLILGKTLFHKKDYTDERYFRKKAFYLLCLSKELLKVSNLIQSDYVKFWCASSSYCSPVLIVKPDGNLSKKCNIILRVVPENNVYKYQLFSPNANNIDNNWYFGENNESEKKFYTPHYNSSILQDLVINSNEALLKDVIDANQNVQDALFLLKIWLAQRNFKGVGNITNYIMSMFVVHLFKKNKINKFMSSYQIVRNVWLCLGQSNWHIEGIKLNEEENCIDISKPSLTDFHSAFQVVFIDSTGYLNFCANVFKSNYIHIKNQSNYAVEMLDNPKINSFPFLFLNKVSFFERFDQFINFHDIKVVREIVKKNGQKKNQLDLREDLLIQFQQIIEPLLLSSLGDRIEEICFEISQEPCEVGKTLECFNNIIVGLKLNPEKAFSVVERGPTANLPEAKEFRTFWGEKSQLRRFKDGEVCEAVVWVDSKVPFHKKRTIIRDIVQYVLKNKLSISSEQFIYIADQAEEVLLNPFVKPIGFEYGTGEDASMRCIDSFNEVGKAIRELDGLPLTVTSVQGVSPVLRYTDVIPPLSRSHTDEKRIKNTKGNCVLASTDEMKIVPGYVQPIEGIIQFASSGKWPNDLHAVKRMITAFYINLAARLTNEYNLVSQPFVDYIDVMKNGFVFRYRIYYPGEVSLLKKEVMPDGMVRYKDTDESLNLERLMVQLPTLTSSLHGLHLQYQSFGPTCCLAKRWLRSQLIDSYHFPDICVELLVASFFLQPEPFRIIYQPTVGLMRFLRKLATTDWFREFVLINFNGDIPKDHISAIECSVAAQQNKTRSAMILVTPFDLKGTSWSKDSPTFTILARLMHLSKKSLEVMENNFLTNGCVDDLKQIFRPPLEGYDVLVKLKNVMNPFRFMAIDAKSNKVYELEPPRENEKIPLTGLNPIQELINNLRISYSEFALFFHDTFGGDTIGIVFKPDTFILTDFKINNVNGRKLNKTNEKKQLEFNLEAFIEDIYALGGSIVKEVVKCNKSFFSS